MTLTRRGRIVFGMLFASFMILTLGLAGRMEAMDQCAEFRIANNYTAALDAGCSFDVLPNGEYPYTWSPNAN